jgi:hypothetical protein
MKLVMTLLVRDEEDILKANFEFHLAQGVDFFIVTDNLSMDGTQDIVESYVRQGAAVVLHEPARDYSQFRWVTRMARMAAACYDADWVINSDADEFWVPATGIGDIKSVLRPIAPEVQALMVPRLNFVPVDEDGAGSFAERMIFRERVSYNTEGDLLLPKVCHRALPDIDVEQGNHQVTRAGAVLSAAPAPLQILHFPIRSYTQFENKIVMGGAAYARNTELPHSTGQTWRKLYACWQAGGLRDYFMNTVVSRHAATTRLLSGELVYDDTVLKVLRRQDEDRSLMQEGRFDHGA